MECEFCQNHEQGDTLYEPSDWDGGIGFDYIRDIKYCPLCGRMLNAEGERVRSVVRDFMAIVDSMRNPTEEETESVNKYLESISEPTGVNIFDMMDELQTDLVGDDKCFDCEDFFSCDEHQTDCPWR